MAGCSQEAHEKPEVEAQVLPPSLVQTGSFDEASVEENQSVLEEQEMQSEDDGSPCCPPQENEEQGMEEGVLPEEVASAAQTSCYP